MTGSTRNFSRSWASLGALAALLALSAGVPMLSARAQQKPPAVFRASANLVRVDVVVRDRAGNIVKVSRPKSSW